MDICCNAARRCWRANYMATLGQRPSGKSGSVEQPLPHRAQVRNGNADRPGEMAPGSDRSTIDAASGRCIEPLPQYKRFAGRAWQRWPYHFICQVMTKASVDHYAEPDAWAPVAPRKDGSWWPERVQRLAAHSTGRLPPVRTALLGGSGWGSLSADAGRGGMWMCPQGRSWTRSGREGRASGGRRH